MLFLQMSQLPHQKAYHDPWCHFILVLSGKSSLVPSRTQGFVPTYCRWADVLRLLYQLPLSCDGRSLGPWAMVIRYFSSDAFAGDDHKLALYFKTLCVCVIWTTTSATFIQTWFVITMFKLQCIEMVWNSSRFHGLPGYTGLSLLNCPPVGWFSYLISYNWVVLLQLVSEQV
jgi:hypothetical protein